VEGAGRKYGDCRSPTKSMPLGLRVGGRFQRMRVGPDICRLSSQLDRGFNSRRWAAFPLLFRCIIKRNDTEEAQPKCMPQSNTARGWGSIRPRRSQGSRHPTVKVGRSCSAPLEGSVVPLHRSTLTGRVSRRLSRRSSETVDTRPEGQEETKEEGSNHSHIML